MSEVEWDRDYYGDGTLRSEYPFVNRQLHGMVKEYWSNGTLSWKTPYINDREHGVEKGYYVDGTLNWTVSYVNGERHGIERHYDACLLKQETLWIRGEERDDLKGDEHRLTRLMLLGEQI